MAKTSKVHRMTGNRKVFLKAVKALQKYFDEHGLVRDEFDSDQIADSIMEIYNKAQCDFTTFASICGSALHVLTQIADERNVNECSETCNGAQAFEAAFFAGWSLGFESGQSDAADAR